MEPEEDALAAWSAGGPVMENMLCGRSKDGVVCLKSQILRTLTFSVFGVGESGAWGTGLAQGRVHCANVFVSIVRAHLRDSELGWD